MRKYIHISDIHPILAKDLKKVPENGMVPYLTCDRLEIFEEEADRLYEEGRDYIWAYRTLYRIALGNDLRLDIIREYRNPKDSGNVSRRGRYHAMSWDEAKKFIVPGGTMLWRHR